MTASETAVGGGTPIVGGAVTPKPLRRIALTPLTLPPAASSADAAATTSAIPAMGTTMRSATGDAETRGATFRRRISPVPVRVSPGGQYVPIADAVPGQCQPQVSRLHGSSPAATAHSALEACGGQVPSNMTPASRPWDCMTPQHGRQVGMAGPAALTAEEHVAPCMVAVAATASALSDGRSDSVAATSRAAFSPALLVGTSGGIASSSSALSASGYDGSYASVGCEPLSSFPTAQGVAGTSVSRTSNAPRRRIAPTPIPPNSL